MSTATSPRNTTATTVETVPPTSRQESTWAVAARARATATTSESTTTTAECPIAKKNPTPTGRRPRWSISRVVSSIAAM